MSFNLNAAGAQKFGRLTEENIGRLLAIVLDGRSNPLHGSIAASRITALSPVAVPGLLPRKPGNWRSS